LNSSNWTPPFSSVAILAKKSRPQPPLATLPIPTIVEEPFEQRSGSISYYYNKYKIGAFV
jgi:hypothetical protein